MLAPGDSAPEFQLPSTSGRTVSLRSLRGHKVVLFFYPKDNTPGCTQEACDFRDSHARLRVVGAEVLGISKDSIASHHKFAGKFELPFELLSDADSQVAQSYGAFGEKNLYGRKILGTIRSTFVIDEQGKVLARWSPVRVPGHVDEVLAVLEGQTPPSALAKVVNVAKRKPATRSKKTSSKPKAPKRRASGE